MIVTRLRTVIAIVALLGSFSPELLAQGTGRGGGGRGGRTVPMDSARARQLYVSNRPEDHPQADFARQIQQRLALEDTTAMRSRGLMDYSTVKYKSSVDGMEIPASLYQPLQKRGPRG